MCATNLNIQHSHESTHISPITMTILGGDTRQLHVACFMAQAGYDIHAMGLGDSLPCRIKQCHNLYHALEGCQALILPLPVTRDKQQINTPLSPTQPISWEDLKLHLSHMPPIHVFGGCIPDLWCQELKAMGCRVTDYYDSQDIQIKNARITAEGAIMTAMELTDTGILGASVAVIGYGRIGQYLSRLLTVWGARVTVYARRAESLAQASSDGCATHDMTQLGTLTQGYQVIFNTVPSRLIGHEILSQMPCQTLLIDLASAPFGIDPEAARELTARCGLGVVYAPSVPGRYAPKSAGEVIAQSILSAWPKEGS